MVGYDVELQKGARGILATWLTSSTLTMPKAEQVRWAYLSTPKVLKTLPTTGYGTPSKYLSSNGSTTIFNCQARLCAIDLYSEKISLVTKEENVDGIESAWIVKNKLRYLVAGIGNKLVSLRAA